MADLRENYTGDPGEESGQFFYNDIFSEVHTYAQTFLTTAGGNIEYVDMLFRSSVGTTSDTVVNMSIQALDGGGKPDGTPLETASITIPKTQTTFTYQTLTLAAPLTVTDATSYAIVLEAGTADADHLGQVAANDTGTAYSDGAKFYTTDGGAWTETGSSDDLVFKNYGAAHAKADNPTPTDADTEVDFSGGVLDWDGTGDTYTVHVANSGGGFIASDIVVTDTAATTYTLTTAQKAKFAGLTDVLYWRVNSTKSGSTLTGDTWTFDPRPGKASVPTPTDANTGIATSTDFSWTLGTNGTTNELLIDGASYLDSSDVTYSMTSDLFIYEAAVVWRVDTTNEYGTTTGDTWTFDAQAFGMLRVSYTLIPGGSGDGPYDATPGTEGTDYWVTGDNNVITVKRLVVAANNKIHYESFG